jgi:hypothetical protein
MEIPVDNIIHNKENSRTIGYIVSFLVLLHEYLDSLNDKTKFQFIYGMNSILFFILGDYDEILPESLEIEYRKLNDKRANEVKDNMHWAWSK